MATVATAAAAVDMAAMAGTDGAAIMDIQPSTEGTATRASTVDITAVTAEAIMDGGGAGSFLSIGAGGVSELN